MLNYIFMSICMRFHTHLSVAILIDNIRKTRTREKKIDRESPNTISEFSRYITKLPGVEKLLESLGGVFRVYLQSLVSVLNISSPKVNMTEP